MPGKPRPRLQITARHSVSKGAQGTRPTAALSVQTPKTEKRVFRDPQRPYPPRKAHLYAQYTNILGSPVPLPTTSGGLIASPVASSHPATPPSIIFISHENFTVAAFTKLRGEINKVLAKVQTAKDRLDASKEPRPEPLSAKLQILRPGIFMPVVRKASGKKEAKKLDKFLRGPIAALIMDGQLDPPLLGALVKIIDKAAPPPPKNASSGAAAKGAALEDEFEAKTKPIPVPRMQVIGAYVDGKVFGKDKVQEWTSLPRLDELRAQIIGLVGAPAAKLSSVLDTAAGGKLSMTLEGWKRELEDGGQASS